MPGKNRAKTRIEPEIILRNVREGHGRQKAFGRTYHTLLERLVSEKGPVTQEVAHKAMWTGGLVRRAREVLGEVRAGNYAFPNTGTRRGRVTCGQELLEHVHARRITMADALSAIRDGRSNRIAFLLDQVESGLHDVLNPADETYQRELIDLVKRKYVSAGLAAAAVRAGYLRRASIALAQTRCGHGGQPSCSGFSYTEELGHLVRLGFSDQEAAHHALRAGSMIARNRRRQDSIEITLAVREGRSAHPAWPYSNDGLTFGEKLKELVAEGIVDVETANVAFMEGRARLVEDCSLRQPEILSEVSNGMADRRSSSNLTYGQELDILVENKVVAKEKAERARARGAEIKARLDGM